MEHDAADAFPEAVAGDQWRRFVDALQEANREFAGGAMEKTRRIWSHGDDVTLFGGYGGLTEPGWRHVEARLAWAASQAAGGTYSFHALREEVSGDFAFLLQLERYLFPQRPPLDVRVTMICRREPDGWKLVHRHGDSMPSQQVAEPGRSTPGA
jgi:ketosteroid isomerase-like protein